MAKHRVKFTFPQEMISHPIIYDLGVKYKIITNIRRADVSADRGWVELEMEGRREDIDKAIKWVSSRKVRVDPVGGDIVEG
jgi:hypothetical protein